MTYRQRLSLFFLVDTSIVLITLFISRVLIEAAMGEKTFPMLLTSISLLVCHHLCSFFLRLYKKSWAYASIGELYLIIKVVITSIFITALMQEIFFAEIYFRLLTETMVLQILFIGGSRF